MRGEIGSLHFLCRSWSHLHLLRFCDVYNVLTWPQRLSEEVKRTCYLIVDNMYKFVEDAAVKLEPLAIVHASMSALSPVTERVSPEAQKHYSK